MASSIHSSLRTTLTLNGVPLKDSRCLSLAKLEQIALDVTLQTPEQRLHLAECRRCRIAMETYGESIVHPDNEELYALLTGALPGVLSGAGKYRVAMEHLDCCRGCYERCLAVGMLARLTVLLPSSEEFSTSPAPENTHAPDWIARPVGIYDSSLHQTNPDIDPKMLAEVARFGDLPARYRLIATPANTSMDALSPVAVPFLWLSLCQEMQFAAPSQRQQIYDRWNAWGKGYLQAECRNDRSLSAVGRLAQHLVRTNFSEFTAALQLSGFPHCVKQAKAGKKIIKE